MLDLSLFPATGKENNENLFQVEAWEYSPIYNAKEDQIHKSFSNSNNLNFSNSMFAGAYNILVAESYYKTKHNGSSFFFQLLCICHQFLIKNIQYHSCRLYHKNVHASVANKTCFNSVSLISGAK